MPIYEYECKSCGERLQVFLLAGEDDGKMACPRCGTGCQKVISFLASVQNHRHRPMQTFRLYLRV
jgi:putative FmdB family regulatory protein